MAFSLLLNVHVQTFSSSKRIFSIEKETLKSHGKESLNSRFIRDKVFSHNHMTVILNRVRSCLGHDNRAMSHSCTHKYLTHPGH